MENVRLRKFTYDDVPKKVRWINDDNNNQFLHYDLPLNLEKTYQWFNRNQGVLNRCDAVIEYEGEPVGIIGLLSIGNGEAEYYVTIGEPHCKGKGIATEATLLLLGYGFNKLKLKRIYLYTEVSNIAAQRLFEKCGFEKQYLLKNSAVNRGVCVDRFYYIMTQEDFMKAFVDTYYISGGGYYFVTPSCDFQLVA